MSNNKYSDESVIPVSFQNNTYEKTMPMFIENYWLTKLFSHRPNINVITKSGGFSKIAVKRIERIMRQSNWADMTAKYMSKKAHIGFGANVIHLVQNRMGETIPRIEVVEGVVRYNEFLGEDGGIEVIEKLTRGTFPILRITSYGKLQDSLRFETNGVSVNNIKDKKEQEEINKLLNITKKIVHNYGFVRASIFRNRSGTNEEESNSWSYGRPHLAGFEDKVFNLDLVLNRINTEVDLNSTHIEVNVASGSVIGSGISKEIKTSLDNKVEEKSGTVKINYRTIETDDGIDSTIIPGEPNPTPLRLELKERLRELYLDLGVQSTYDSEGKTNDTNAKVDKVGDQAHKEATLRTQQEVEYWSNLFEMAMAIDVLTGNGEFWKDVESVQIKPRMNDFRTKIEMMDKIDKLIKILPLNEIFEKMFDISSDEALEMVNQKELEVKDKVVAFLGVSNGNLPQNIQVDFGWGTVVEKEEPDKNTSKDKDDDN